MVKPPARAGGLDFFVPLCYLCCMTIRQRWKRLLCKWFGHGPLVFDGGPVETTLQYNVAGQPPKYLWSDEAYCADCGEVLFHKLTWRRE